MHIAIQGEQASFHELAAKKYYKKPITLLYCDTFEEVFTALVNGKVDRAFVAVSNSAHGKIQLVENLLHSHAHQLENYYAYAVRQHLIGTHEATLDTISTVVSHPVALSQCEVHLQRFKRLQEYHDTSAAVRHIAELNIPSMAALGSEEAAALYGLKVIARDLHDDPENITIFASLLPAQNAKNKTTPIELTTQPGVRKTLPSRA